MKVIVPEVSMKIKILNLKYLKSVIALVKFEFL